MGGVDRDALASEKVAVAPIVAGRIDERRDETRGRIETRDGCQSNIADEEPPALRIKVQRVDVQQRAAVVGHDEGTSWRRDARAFIHGQVELVDSGSNGDLRLPGTKPV